MAACSPAQSKAKRASGNRMLFVMARSRLANQRVFGRSQGGRGLLLGLGLVLDLDQRLEPDLAVMVEAGAGWDAVAHDDGCLEAAQVIDARPGGRFGQHAGGILEGRSAKE